jgi:hypothetical protein
VCDDSDGKRALTRILLTQSGHILHNGFKRFLTSLTSRGVAVPLRCFLIEPCDVGLLAVHDEESNVLNCYPERWCCFEDNNRRVTISHVNRTDGVILRSSRLGKVRPRPRYEPKFTSTS